MHASDLRYALRLIRLRPGSSLAVVLTLALAIGANSTLFTLINAALFSPLPIRDIDRLVNVYTSGTNGAGFGGLSYPDFQDLRSAGEVFSEAIGYSGLIATATGEAGSEMVFGELVTANYFSMLGISPALGRGFEAREGEERGAHPVVVIGDRLWHRRFGSDPNVVGRTMTLNGRPYTIVGVAPKDFPGLLFRAISSDVWVPVSMMGQLRTDQLDNRDERWMFVKARLAPDVTADRASAAARAIATRLASAYPATNRGRTFPVLPTREVVVHPNADAGVFAASAALMLSSALVLIVACANLSGVMLARGLARQREISIRLAIGARRSDIVRQLLVESVVLAIAGAAFGLLLAKWAAGALAAWRPDLPVPVSLNTAIDLRVVLFTLAVSIAATAAFALLPAFRSARTPAAGSNAIVGPRRRRRLFGLRDGMLVPQLAIALLLIATAALLARSLSRADAVDPGFDIDRTAFVSLFLEMSGYDDARAERFYRELGARLVARGTASDVAVTGRLPLDLYGNRSLAISSEDDPSIRHVVQAAPVTGGYFRAMGIRMVRGRGFDARDEDPASPPVVIVSQAAARAYWGDTDPIGRRIRIGDGTPGSTVVGVASDVKVQTLGEAPQPFLYQPLRSDHAGLLRLVAHGNADPRAVVRDMRAVVRQMDPSVALFEARTMNEYLDVMLYPYRLAAGIGIAFGLLAIALAGIGLYGVLACGVGERVRELAIRTALGATPASLIRSTAAETARAAAVGLAIGTLLALAAGRALAEYLFGISPADPLAIAATAAVLLGVVGLASAGPVRRAIRVEPIQALREP